VLTTSDNAARGHLGAKTAAADLRATAWPYGGRVITAIVMVHTAADRIPETAQAIADLDGVAEVYSCAGDVDLVAIVRVSAHEELAEVIAGRLSKVEGVHHTDTHIAFRSYAKADTDATFSIGLD
jgi:DNA-binding Lrp family transcriptional regulator